MAEIGGIIALAAHGYGAEIGAVRLNKQTVHGADFQNLNGLSGIFVGLSTITISLLVRVTSYTTLGDVVIISIPNSRLILSSITSICNKPKNPQRKPKPNASETSGSYWFYWIKSRIYHWFHRLISI